MTPAQYLNALDKLGYNAYTAHTVLGISLRQSFRLASGESAVPEPVARLLHMLRLHGIPKEWR